MLQKWAVRYFWPMRVRRLELHRRGGRRSFLRHSAPPQTNEKSRFVQGADFRHPEISAHLQAGDGRIMVIAEPLGFREFGGGAFGFASPLASHWTASSCVRQANEPLEDHLLTCSTLAAGIHNGDCRSTIRGGGNRLLTWHQMPTERMGPPPGASPPMRMTASG